MGNKTIAVSNRINVPAILAIVIVAATQEETRVLQPGIDVKKNDDDLGKFPEADLRIECGGNFRPEVGDLDTRVTGLSVARRLKGLRGGNETLLDTVWSRYGKEACERILYGNTGVSVTTERGDTVAYAPEDVADRIATQLEVLERDHKKDRQAVLLAVYETVGDELQAWAEGPAVTSAVTNAAKAGINQYDCWDEDALQQGVVQAAALFYARFEDALAHALTPLSVKSMTTCDGGRVLMAPRKLTGKELETFAKANPDVAAKLMHVVFQHTSGEFSGCYQLEPVSVNEYGEIVEKASRARVPFPTLLDGYTGGATWPGLEDFTKKLSNTELEVVLRRVVPSDVGTIGNVRVAETSIWGSMKALITSDADTALRLARGLRDLTTPYVGKERKVVLARLPRIRR